MILLKHLIYEIEHERDRVFPDTLPEILDIVKKLPDGKALFIFNKDKTFKMYITKRRNKYMVQMIPSMGTFSDKEIGIEDLVRHMFTLHVTSVFSGSEFFFKIEDYKLEKEKAPAGGEYIPSDARGLLELFGKLPEDKKVTFFNNKEGTILVVVKHKGMYLIGVENSRGLGVRKKVDIRGINPFIGIIRGKDKPDDRVRFNIDFPDDGAVVAESTSV